MIHIMRSSESESHTESTLAQLTDNVTYCEVRLHVGSMKACANMFIFSMMMCLKLFQMDFEALMTQKESFID